MPIKEFEDLTPEELARYDDFPFAKTDPIFRKMAFVLDWTYFTEEEKKEYADELGKTVEEVEKEFEEKWAKFEEKRASEKKKQKH